MSTQRTLLAHPNIQKNPDEKKYFSFETKDEKKYEFKDTLPRDNDFQNTL